MAGGGAPYQIEATTEDGQYFYLRYRGGRLRAGVSQKEGDFWRGDNKWNYNVIDEVIGDEYDGIANHELFSSLLKDKVKFPEGFTFNTHRYYPDNREAAPKTDYPFDVQLNFLEQLIEEREKTARLEKLLRAADANLTRFTAGGLLDCHAICDQRDNAVIERNESRKAIDRLRRQVTDLSSLYMRAEGNVADLYKKTQFLEEKIKEETARYIKQRDETYEEAEKLDWALKNLIYWVAEICAKAGWPAKGDVWKSLNEARQMRAYHAHWKKDIQN